MDILEICPPKNLVFSLPTDLHRVLTITNLTLRSLYVHILRSHPYELSLSREYALMSAFEELKIEVGLNLNQEMQNAAVAKLRVYYYQTDEEEDEEAMRRRAFSPDNKTQFEEITIQYDVQSVTNSLEAPLSSPTTNFLMRRLYPKRNPGAPLAAALAGDRLKNEIFNYIQHLSYVASIQQCENNLAFLLELKQGHEELCEFVTFTINDTAIVFVIARIIAYGRPSEIHTLVSIDSDEEVPSKPVFDNKPTQAPAEIPKKDEQEMPMQAVMPSSHDYPPADKRKKDLSKQSFAVKREHQRVKTKRRNKSEQKIHEASEESDQQDAELRKQMRNMRLAGNFDIRLPTPPPPPPVKIRHQVKINQTNIELPQKVLAVVLDFKENFHYIYVIVRDSVRVMVLQDPAYKRTIKFDPIDPEHVSMPTPADIYRDELIFGNESYLFWVNLCNGQNEWKYVQRKYIYALAVIEELSLVALGGKNFSKLSYFGKETSRSNLKLYSCSASDKHDHLFTYDFPASNVGHVASMAYVTAPPLATKLLLVHTVAPGAVSTFFFLRVKAFNKIEVYGQVEIDQLGILNLLKFKYNKDTGRVVCMEALGDTAMDSFKRLKIKCQYEKVEVSTEGLKLPLKRFTSFHLGGGKEGPAREWMSFVQDNGCVFYLYDLQGNKLDTFQLGKGEVRQVFSLYNGKFLLICSDWGVRIRQKVQVEIKE